VLWQARLAVTVKVVVTVKTHPWLFSTSQLIG